MGLVGEVPLFIYFLTQVGFWYQVLPSGFEEDSRLLGSKIFPAVLF